ncbi:MAG: RNHCP domain-containing protein [Oscillospiraceae bacterium]|nr:RNHCP domain-containing protein [Oscillospiraceae bacterium]
MGRKFTVIDEGFVCAFCGAEIKRLGYTSRDHCNVCLLSLHADDAPGDRESGCGGVLRPIGLELNKKGRQIVYKCEKCGLVKKNIAANDDNEDLIIELSVQKSRPENRSEKISRRRTVG